MLRLEHVGQVPSIIHYRGIGVFGHGLARGGALGAQDVTASGANLNCFRCANLRWLRGPQR